MRQSYRARRRDLSLGARRIHSAGTPGWTLGQDVLRCSGRRRILESYFMSEALGRIVATEKKPNTPHEFHFWTAIDSPVGIGTIVRVDGAQPIEGQIPHVYGIVIEGFSYTDLQSPMHDVLGHDGSPTLAGFASTERAEIRLYTAAVLRQIPEEPLQPVPMGPVYLAEERDGR